MKFTEQRTEPCVYCRFARKLNWMKVHCGWWSTWLLSNIEPDASKLAILAPGWTIKTSNNNMSFVCMYVCIDSHTCQRCSPTHWWSISGRVRGLKAGMCLTVPSLLKTHDVSPACWFIWSHLLSTLRSSHPPVLVLQRRWRADGGEERGRSAAPPPWWGSDEEPDWRWVRGGSRPASDPQLRKLTRR